MARAFAHAALLIVSGLAVVPLVRIFVQPKLMRAFPGVAIAFGSASAAYLAALAALALWLPAALPVVAAAASGGYAWLAWRGRRRYGSRRKLPPGSLAILQLEPWINRRAYADLAALYGPVFKTSHFFHPMVCIMKLESGVALLKQHDDVRLRSPKAAPDRFLPCGFLRGMDPEAHAIYRRVVQSLMTSDVVSKWERSIAADTDAALASLVTHTEGVYAKPAWDRLLFISFSRLFFGIQPGSDEFRRWEAGARITSHVSQRRISIRWLPSERLIERTLQDLCAMLQQHDGGDSLLGEIRRQHPQNIDDQQLLRLLIFLLHLSSGDMVGLVQWFAKTLCDFPDASLRLRKELDAGVSQHTPNSLADRMLNETLRRCQVEHIYRRVLEDIEWEGYRIPKGWLLRICLAEAHRDPAVFEKPDQFDPDRFLTPPHANHYLPFGAFRRSCIGEPVVRTFGRQFLCTWTQRWNGRQVGQSHEDYSTWHWTPGADFRVVVTPRA